MFIITNQDNPNASVRDAQRVARNRAKDLRGNGIQLGIFGLQGGEKLEPSFQLETFYSSLPGIAPEDWEGEELNGTIVSTPKDLVETISIKDNYRKTAFRIPFSLAPGLEVGIEGYHTLLALCMKQIHSLKQ